MCRWIMLTQISRTVNGRYDQKASDKNIQNYKHKVLVYNVLYKIFTHISPSKQSYDELRRY